MLSFIRGRRQDKISTFQDPNNFPVNLDSALPDSQSANDFPAHSAKVASALLDSQEDLIYYIDRITSYERLCISQLLVKEIFQLAYRNGYLGFLRYYKIVSILQYIRGLSK